MAALCDRAVRVELGIPRRVAARLAGVDRRTLTMFEAAKDDCTAETVERCEELYRLLRSVLRDAPGLRRR